MLGCGCHDSRSCALRIPIRWIAGPHGASSHSPRHSAYCCRFRNTCRCLSPTRDCADFSLRRLQSLDNPPSLGNSRSMDKRVFSVREILAGAAPAETPVTVKGWVRTRRDSKAGISFVHLSDGSSFHPLQIVVANTLPNYTDEVLKLTTGCALEATGTIVPSPLLSRPRFRSTAKGAPDDLPDEPTPKPARRSRFLRARPRRRRGSRSRCRQPRSG